VTPKQRFLAAVRGDVPDRVPVAPLIHDRFAHKMLGRTGWKAVYEVHQMIGSIHHRGPIGVELEAEMPDGWYTESETVEQTPPRKVVRETLHTSEGSLTAEIVFGFSADDPLISKPVKYRVSKPEDWDVFRRYQEQRLANLKGCNIDTVEEAARVMGEEGVPSVGIGCPMAGIGDARGMQDMILDLVDHPDLIQGVWEVLMALVEKEMEGFLASSSEVVWYDICWSTGSNLGPDMFRKWTLPAVQRAVDLVHSKQGKYIGLYTLGRMRKLLPMLVDAGVDFIETLEPNEGDISLGEAKRTYGDRVCLMGNFDCLVLARGSVDEAREEAMRCLREGMEGGGYVMVTADEVPTDTRLENLEAMVQTALEHGVY